jgi:regulator of sigma E protease
MISLALAIFNILPIPALDWGRVVWVIIQKVFRIKPEKYFVWEWYVNTVFFVLLMLLWVYIILKDLAVYRWISIPFIW